MKHVLDRTGAAAGRQAVQIEAEVLPLIAHVDGGVPAPLGLLLLHHGGRHGRFRARHRQVGPLGGRALHGLRPTQRQRRRREVALHDERRIRRHAGQRFQLQGGDLDPALGELAARVEPVDLDDLQALVQRRRRALAHAVADDGQRVAVHAQQILGHAEAALRGQDLAGLHADVRAKAALAIVDLPSSGIQLALGHRDAPFLAPVEIQGQGHPDVEVVVRADGLLSPELQHRIRAQPRLLHSGRRRLHVDPRRLQVGIVGQGTGDELVHGQLPARLAGGEAWRKRGDTDRQRHEQHSGAVHGRTLTGQRRKTSWSPCPPARPR